MSVLFQNYKHYGLVCVIDINTHVLIYFLYNFVLLLALFWTMGRGFNQYSYYWHWFSLWPVVCAWHCHCHMWVRCFETTNLMVLCMSSILIHMSYFTFYIISSFYSHCSEPRVMGLTNTAIIVTFSIWGQFFVFYIAIVTRKCDVLKLKTLRSCVCHRY